MMIPRSGKSVSKYLSMIAHINHLLIKPYTSERPIITMQNPSFGFSNIRCLRRFRSIHIPEVSTSDAIHIPKVPNFDANESSSSGVATRITRVARIEAQSVLFDYLYCTRSFTFTDAEYISKNSPHFVHFLLSKFDNEKDVTRSLTKFLRFHPINEFEPFLESLGLQPDEFSSLLPRNLMYLSDDDVMLHNFHHLCNYGIPRSKMGKMYMEAKEIFEYDRGVLDAKLQAYENLGLSNLTVIKLVSCCPSLLLGGISKEFVAFLEQLKELGIEQDWIKGYLCGKYTYDWNRMLDTIDFLGKVGYSKEDMCNLFKTNPAFLFKGSGKKVYVLFGRFLKLGLKMDEVYSLFRKNPLILSEKCSENLLQALNFLLEIGLKTEDIADIVSTNMQLMGSSPLKGPRTVCKNFKVGKDGLCQIVKEDPLAFFRVASKLKANNAELLVSQDSITVEKSTFLLRLGYIENSEEMAKAIKQFRGRGDQLQERFNCLVEAGLDVNVAISMIKQAPMVLNQTKDVIVKKIDCLRNCLGYPLKSVIAFPAYLCYDMARINLRFSMYAWLRKRGAAKPSLSLSTLLACSDARFVKYFVDVHPEGPAIWESLKHHL